MMRHLLAYLSMLLLLMPLCPAPRRVPLPIPYDLFSAALHPFIEQLRTRNTLNPATIHSTLDLLHAYPQHHHVLSQHFFKNGKDWDPEVIYLSEHPSKPQTHMVVAHFEPEVMLKNRLLPRQGSLRGWQDKKGLLAINLRAEDEPEFVGVLWFRKEQTAKWLRDTGVQTKLSE